MVKLANTTDLKSVARLGLSVRVRPLVPYKKTICRVSLNTVKPVNDFKIKIRVGMAAPSQERLQLHL